MNGENSDCPSNRLEIMSTRLFPKGHGAGAYVATGMASRCDWVVMSDDNSPHTKLVGNPDAQPNTVFLSLRSPFFALAYFHDEVLPRISEPFVLISGSEDITIPNQLDARWRRFNAVERDLIDRILNDERIIHWFAENLDTTHPKMSPVPVGYVFQAPGDSHIIAVPKVRAIGERQVSVLCSHRIRSGSQWETRRKVSRLCETSYRECTNLVSDPVSEAEFIKLVESHVFVLCVEGGGLDPSPKAWLSILHGAIPIIRSTALDAAYSGLPVVILPDWTEDALTPSKLQGWLARFRRDFEDEAARRKVLYRLSLDYWWTQVVLAYRRNAGAEVTRQGSCI